MFYFLQRSFASFNQSGFRMVVFEVNDMNNEYANNEYVNNEYANDEYANDEYANDEWNSRISIVELSLIKMDS